MGGQQPTTKEYPYAKYFNNEGNPYNKTQDEKLNDLKAELKDYAGQVWDDLSMLYAFSSQETKDRVGLREDIEDNEMLLKDEITSLKKEIDFLKQQITNGSSGKWGAYASKEEMQNQFKDFRQMQIFLKQEFDKLSSKVDAITSGCLIAKPAVTIEQPKICANTVDKLDGWMKMVDLVDHLKELCVQGKLKIDSSYLIKGHINKLYLKLHLVKIINTTGAMQVSGTDLGKQLGYVMGVNSGKTHLTYYNVEKCVKILEDCSTPESLIKTIDVFDEKHQQQVVA